MTPIVPSGQAYGFALPARAICRGPTSTFEFELEGFDTGAEGFTELIEPASQLDKTREREAHADSYIGFLRKSFVRARKSM